MPKREYSTALAGAVLGVCFPLLVSSCAAPAAAPEEAPATETAVTSANVEGEPANGTVHQRLLAAGLERVTSGTATDWASVADVVVVGEVVSETRIDPPESETATESPGLIGRAVEVKVNSVLWTSPDSKHGLNSSSITLNVIGWLDRGDGEQEQVVSMEGSSRLDVGHEYVLALVWMEAECSTGDQPEPARWSTIGSGGRLPADDGIVGNGEFEGRMIDVSEAEAAASHFASSSEAGKAEQPLFSSMAGLTPDSLVPELDSAETAAQRIDFQVGARRCAS